MSFLSGFFGGSGGQTTNSYQTSNTNFNPDAGYTKFARDTMKNVEGLRDAAFKKYDVSNFGPMFNADMQSGWDQLKDVNNQWGSYFDAARGQADQAAGINPMSFASQAFQNGMNGPTALGAAQPYFDKANQSWADVSSQYMNPYTEQALKASNDLTTKNFLQNVVPSFANTFVSSGGGLGSKQYGNGANWMLTNFNDSLNRTNLSALSDEWNKAAGIFGNDAARWAGLGNGAANAATADRSGWTGLGTAMSNSAGQTQAGFNNTAGTYANLGTGATSNALTGAKSTLQAGQGQQDIENWKKNFEYDQFNKEQQWPYQTNSWAADVVNKFTWPYSTNSTSSGYQTSSGSSQNSPFGSLLGLASAVGSLAIPGAGGTSALGNIFGSGLGSGGAGATLGTTGVSGIGPVQVKRGGSIKPRKFARGGYFGLDAASSPPFITNPGYFKWMEPHAFSQGGEVGGIGKTLGSILGGIAGGFFGGPIGSTLGSMGGSALGGLLPFASGGAVPVIRAVRNSNTRSLDAIRNRPTPARGVKRPLAFPASPAQQGFFGNA